jgi:hypothetical protein
VLRFATRRDGAFTQTRGRKPGAGVAAQKIILRWWQLFSRLAWASGTGLGRCGTPASGRRGVDIRIKPSPPLAYLRRARMWLVPLASHDQHLDLDRQLIGMPVRSPRAVGQSVRRDQPKADLATAKNIAAI